MAPQVWGHGGNPDDTNSNARTNKVKSDKKLPCRHCSVCRDLTNMQLYLPRRDLPQIWQLKVRWPLPLSRRNLKAHLEPLGIACNAQETLKGARRALEVDGVPDDISGPRIELVTRVAVPDICRLWRPVVTGEQGMVVQDRGEKSPRWRQVVPGQQVDAPPHVDDPICRGADGQHLDAPALEERAHGPVQRVEGAAVGDEARQAEARELGEVQDDVLAEDRQVPIGLVIRTRDDIGLECVDGFPNLPPPLLARRISLLLGGCGAESRPTGSRPRDSSSKRTPITASPPQRPRGERACKQTFSAAGGGCRRRLEAVGCRAQVNGKEHQPCSCNDPHTAATPADVGPAQNK
mmetsp:Transcript_27334/g.88248  ORF Transcript_27334/g.88248 Transcript_27334/m.88248 type:complete len:349 (+) Transcript_27334:77-1123(+)